MLCPNCGHTAQPGLARCGHCNIKLPESALPGAASGNEKNNCWNCTHPNDAHALICVACNARTERPQAFLRRAQHKTQHSTLKTAWSHDE